MTYLTWQKQAHTSPQHLTTWPKVIVQLPIYNEMYVAKRVIDATAKLNYPAELLQIQVLDDSTDETQDIVKTAVEHWQQQGVNICHLTRPTREGYKAGALQAGLEQAEGEYIAMFDADFVPPPDYLKEVIPHFTPQIAFIQARWGHLNDDYSLLTSLQSVAIDAHFMVEQQARAVNGYWFNFNGTAGIWRRTALEDAGGWQADTLTEDLDISYRALMRGWQARYLRDLIVPAELPVSMTAFRRQQHRWARGSLECALKLGRQMWQTAVPLRLKLEGTLHLTGYCVHLLLFAMSVLYLPVLFFAQQQPQILTLFGLTYLLGLTAFAPTFLFIMGQWQQGKSWQRSLPKIFFVTVVGCGMMINTVRAALQIVTRTHNAFERTAKFGIQQKGERWVQKQYQLKIDGIIFWELLFALFNLHTMLWAVWFGNWPIAFFTAIFFVGLMYISLITVWQSVAIWWQSK